MSFLRITHNGEQMTDDETFELVTLIGRRIRLLERLVDGPVSKRDLLDEVDTSRSTVDRAIKDLEETGLVAWSDQGYQTTLAGKLLTTQYRTFARHSATVFESLPILDALPPDAPLGPPLLDGSTVVHTGDLSRYELPEQLVDLLKSANRLVVVLTPEMEPEALKPLRNRIVTEKVTAEIYLAPELLDVLERRFRSTATGLAAGDGRIYEVEGPPFGLTYAPEENEVIVSVTTDDKATVGLLCNDTPAAGRWAEELVEELQDAAIEVTDELESLDRPATDDRSQLLAGDRLRLRTEGFVEPSERYFDRREPAPPATSWRTGLSLAEVAAGLAVDRERPADVCAGSTPNDEETGTSNGKTQGRNRRAVGDEVLEMLLNDGNVAVLGPPGSGKSTICKTVASRWYERGYGPVLYRESGTGEPFESWPLLVEAVRANDGHVLVVVEDAVRPGARAVFRALTELDGDDASVLVDSREGEWGDPSAEPMHGTRSTVQTEAIETVVVPPLDEHEVERFVERFEVSTGHDVEAEPSELLAEVRNDDAEGAAPAELQLLGHHLSLRAAPLSAEGSRSPTTLVEDVRKLHHELEAAGEIKLSVGVLANALNVAGVAVRPAYLHAVAPANPDAVREARAILQGRVLFEEDGTFRTVHESWSALFLTELLTTAHSEEIAADLFGESVGRFLALADDHDLRTAVDSAVGGETPSLDRIADQPGTWAEETVGRIFGIGRENPGLAPLYGRYDAPTVTLPEAYPDDRRVETAYHRARMYLHGGYLDRAKTEFEAILDHTEGSETGSEEQDRPRNAETGLKSNVDRTPPTAERIGQLRARVQLELGTVARRQGDYDAAEERFRTSHQLYLDLDDDSGVADSRKRLGNVAWARGEYQTAERRYREVLETYRELGDRLGGAYTLHNLGNVRDAVGDADAAEDHYRDALSIYREIGTRRDEADCLNNLGVLAETSGDFGAAREYYREGLQLYRALGNRHGIAHTVTNLGITEAKRGRPEAAEEYARRGLQRYRTAGDQQGVADARGALGKAARLRDEFDDAEEQFQERLAITREIDDAVGEATSHLGLARLARDRNDLDTAVERGTRALERFRELGRPRDQCAARVLLGSVARLRNEFDAAEEHLQGARKLSRTTGDTYREGRTLAELGELALARNDTAAARDRLAAAAELFEGGEATGWLAYALDRLATACERDDDPEAAERARSKARESNDESNPGP